VLEAHLAGPARRVPQGRDGLPGPGPRRNTVFDGAREYEILDAIRSAHRTRRRPSRDEVGKAVLYDGRNGEPYEERVTVGVAYILKLLHLVDDRSRTLHRPYSMITQQPLGGRRSSAAAVRRDGGVGPRGLRRAYALQELLTIKSDDVLGRVKVYEAS